jgi:hypothetical protein
MTHRSAVQIKLKEKKLLSKVQLTKISPIFTVTQKKRYPTRSDSTEGAVKLHENASFTEYCGRLTSQQTERVYTSTHAPKIFTNKEKS